MTPAAESKEQAFWDEVHSRMVLASFGWRADMRQEQELKRLTAEVKALRGMLPVQPEPPAPTPTPVVVHPR